MALTDFPDAVLSLIWTALDSRHRHVFSGTCKRMRQVHIETTTSAILDWFPQRRKRKFVEELTHIPTVFQSIVCILTRYTRLRTLQTPYIVSKCPQEVWEGLTAMTTCGFPLHQLHTLSLPYLRLVFKPPCQYPVETFLEKLSGLQSLTLGGRVPQALGILTGLTRLDLSGSSNLGDAFPNLLLSGRFPHLQVLILEGVSVSCKLLRGLASVSSLQELHMQRIMLCVDDFENIFTTEHSLNGLTYLDLTDITVPFSDMEMLTTHLGSSNNLRNLQHIKLCGWPNSMEIVALALDNKSWPRLKSAEVWSHHLAWPDQERLAQSLLAATYLTSLTALCFNDECETDMHYSIDEVQAMTDEAVRGGADATEQMLARAQHLGSLRSLEFKGTHPGFRQAIYRGLLAATYFTNLSDLYVEDIMPSQLYQLVSRSDSLQRVGVSYSSLAVFGIPEAGASMLFDAVVALGEALASERDGAVRELLSYDDLCFGVDWIRERVQTCRFLRLSERSWKVAGVEWGHGHDDPYFNAYKGRSLYGKGREILF